MTYKIIFSSKRNNCVIIDMQTFLQYPDFEKTFKCLDYRRLGKQRVEAMQIYNIISGRSNKKG